MTRYGSLTRIVTTVAVFAAVLGTGIFERTHAQTQTASGKSKMRSTTQAQRKAAAQRRKELRTGTASATGATTSKAPSTAASAAAFAATLAIDPATGLLVPDYFGVVPNYANSPLPIVDAATGTISGGIRKFVDPLPNLPIAVPDACAFSGQSADCYEIELREYTQKMHSDLPATKLRGYVQVKNGVDVAPIQYLGPVIVAQRDKPVRVTFRNKLAVDAGGDLFIPTDTTYMGAGMGPVAGQMYKQNRATLHLHGGTTPWISDGTPHQWTTPAGETTAYPQGVSVKNVPDMDGGNEPQGTLTFFYSNQQSARLMFYHDHAYGITRLNVYAGEAAGYVLTDQVEENLIAAGTLPGIGMPLVIQDKTFVPDNTVPITNFYGSFPSQLAAQDPTWDSARWGGFGSLWYPHVYMPNQNPWDVSGANAMGRWDYGPWFWPPFTGLQFGPVLNPYVDQAGEPPMIPGTPNPSGVPEAFMDTPIVNGMAYPKLTVDPKLYRFRILNAANDRFLNLSFFVAADKTAPTTAGGAAPVMCTTGAVNPDNCTEVAMVPFNSSQNAITPFPTTWYTQGLPFSLDDRVGGVPNPTTRGPAMIQIGTEGGLLPMPALIRNQPINYNYNRRDITVGNILQKALFLAPAERADILVDFSAFAGQTLILYNDAPAPVPAADPRLDYFTGAPDMTDTGGAPTTLPGYGPNIRTVMQIRVSGSGSGAIINDAYDAAKLASLQAAIPAAFKASQDAIVVPQAPYNAAYNPTTPFPGDASAYVKIQDTSFAFTPIGALAPVTANLQPKSIIEDFQVDYGRMNALLGVEIPKTTVTNQTSIPQGYIDPPTEVIKFSDAITPMGTAPDGTQLWKITHNGVDTHAMHFHMFNVQIVNRVGWDGALKPPDPNELGWKDTIRTNPLEDIIVALRPIRLTNVPFKLPNSIRPLDVTRPVGSLTGFTNVDPNGNPVTVTNDLTNFGWEYVWHCHLLGHEENDMMRGMILAVPPEAPSNLAASRTGAGATTRVALTWTNNALNATSVTVQRATNSTFTQGLLTIPLGVAATYTDPIGATTQSFFYRVYASNTVGSTTLGYPTMTLDSPFSNTATPVVTGPPAAPSNLAATLSAPRQVRLTWSDNSTNETGFTLQRATNATFTTNLTSFTIAPDTTTFTDTTVAVLTTYFYRIRAVNGALLSAFSNTASILVLGNANGLVMALNFNEAAGAVANDSTASGNGNNGTISGALHVAGQFGNALSFNGTNALVTVASNASFALTNGMTLEAWVKPTAISSSGWTTIILKERTTAGLSYALYANDGAANPSRPAGYARIGFIDQEVTGTPGLPLNTWTHVAVTYDGATMRLYVGGVLRAARAQTGNIVTSTDALRIGGNTVFASEYFSGLIDEVRVYNRALSPAQIGADMGTPIP